MNEQLEAIRQILQDELELINIGLASEYTVKDSLQDAIDGLSQVLENLP